MAEGSEQKQDFAPPWLKFPPTDASRLNGGKPNGNRQRRDDPYAPRPDFNRIHRQSSFDFHEGKRFHPGQPKFRHHSVEEDFYYPPYYNGYYPPAYGYERMHYSSQPALGRSMRGDGKFFPPRPQGMRRGGYHEKDYYRGGGNYREYDERGRPFSDDFPSLVSNGEHHGDSHSKSSKPGHGVWENPPKSNNRTEESSDLLKNSSTGIYKALVPNKNSTAKKQGPRDGVRMNGNVKDSSPLSPSNKANTNKEGNGQSPAAVTIVTQPKKLGDKKSDFLKTLRNETSVRNGDCHQDHNQNSVGKKQASRAGSDSPMNEDENVNGNLGSDEVNGKELQKEEKNDINGDGETLISDVDHINLQGEEEEKRLLLAMGWDEKDDTEYVITDDEIKEFQNLLQSHCQTKKNGLKSSLRNVLNKNFTNGLNGGSDAKESQTKSL